MTNGCRCVVVIPCLNEEAAIFDLVRAVAGHVQDVVVVDDGSSDRTAEQARAAGATVVRFEENQGKGAALNAGLKCVTDRGFNFALIMDGDGQHSPEDLPRFLECVRADDVDLVIGDRMGHRDVMPWLRRFVNLWMSRQISNAAGRDLPDTQCGFRLIRLSLWRELELSTTGFEVESEMLLACVRRKARVRFVPVQTIYKTRQSKIHPLRDTVRWFRWWRGVRR